jgi:predicted  nucleic acid-binding Zn-ribbon protein
MKDTLERLWQLQELDQKMLGLRGSTFDIAAGVQEIEAQKVPMQNQILPKYLVLYRRIAVARGGLGAARLRGGSCGACNMVLPPQFVTELSRSLTIEQCPNCKRILVPQCLATQRLQ